MPSLLKKHSYYDAESGRYLIVADNGFYWKQGKKSPEESKVTRLMTSLGWNLMSGNDVWLIFKKRGVQGEITVTRGSKEWYWDKPSDPSFESSAEGVGLESLQEALTSGTIGGKAKAMHASPASTAVNNAGSGHEEVDGELRPDARVAREIMHDDCGCQTGLRNRPDYGESDSYTSEMNDANAKGAAVLIVSGGKKTKSGAIKIPLYVTAVEFAPGSAFKLATFRFSPDASKAKVFRQHTAENLQKQIRRFGAVARVKLAAESSLNGFSVMSLDDFVSGEEPEEKMAASPAMGEVKRDAPATEQEFGLGSKHRELSDEEMREYMERVENRSEYEKDKEKNKGKGKKTDEAKAEAKAEEERVKAERQKDKYSLPILHRGNIHIVDNSGKEYDLDRLKNDIMKRPDKLLKKNEKMQHSGITKQYYNIGLAALKGLAVNEKTGKFVVVDTCPGAGICKTYCYAMRGNYVRMPATSLNQSRILNFLVNQPGRFASMLKAEIALAESKADEGTKVVVRWHDAGDFFSPQYMNLAFDVARSFPNVEFYAYTKVGDVANAEKPANFIINFSEGALPGETKKVDLTQIKSSITVPQKRFWDLIVTKGAHTVKDESGQVQFKNAKAWDEFKGRLVEDYKINKDTILLYNEYMAKKENNELGEKPRWNVVVPPGGGDDAANDPTVIGSYLMWH